MSDVVSTAFFEQEEQNETNDGTKAWPARPCQLFLYAAALSVVLMILTSLMISLYKRVTHTTELEGIL